MLEQLCLQSKSTENLAVNCSTEKKKNIYVSGRLVSYLCPSCSARRINLYAKVGVYYTYNNSNKTFEWAKYIQMLAIIQIHKYLIVSPSTNNYLEVLRTLMRWNTPTQIMVTYMCGQDPNVSWFRNWTMWVRHKNILLGARQYSRCRDRHVHRLTSPPAWDHWAVVLQSNACNNSAHHQLLAFGWTTHIVCEWNTHYLSIGQE